MLLPGMEDSDGKHSSPVTMSVQSIPPKDRMPALQEFTWHYIVRNGYRGSYVATGVLWKRDVFILYSVILYNLYLCK